MCLMHRTGIHGGRSRIPAFPNFLPQPCLLLGLLLTIGAKFICACAKLIFLRKVRCLPQPYLAPDSCHQYKVSQLKWTAGSLPSSNDFVSWANPRCGRVLGLLTCCCANAHSHGSFLFFFLCRSVCVKSCIFTFPVRAWSCLS